MAIPRSYSRGAASIAAALTFAACTLIGGSISHHPATATTTVSTTAAPADDDARANNRIVVSLGQRRLWLIQGRDTLLAAPIAVGKGQTFQYRGRTFRFQTPRGTRRVIAKETNPVWVPPDWHYFEKAARRDLEPVHLKEGDRHPLGDGSSIEVRNGQVGRVNRFGNFWPFTPGSEIIFYGKIFIPPLDSAQRRVPDALGTHKLDLGDGYLIHGTHEYNRGSIGRAVSHGCIRMRNEDVARLYDLVDVGTPVQIR